MSDLSVTIVMPVYNTDKKLMKTCIDSIKRQTYPNWTLLIVDDGSLPETAAFCDSFTEDGRIKVIHQKNTGVSGARNNGTMNAGGDYILYVDADDILSDFVLEEGVNIARSLKADVVCGGVCKIGSQEKFAEYANLRGDGKGTTKYSLDEIRRRVLGELVKGLNEIGGCGYIGRGPWGKLIKRELAQTLLFPDNLPIGEDLIWNLRLFNSCENCVVADSIWYGYVLYSASAISKYYGNREEIVLKWYGIVKEENAAFFDRYKGTEGLMLSKELYSIIRYDILPPQREASMSEKNKTVARMMKREPWKLLNNKEYCTKFSFSRKMLMTFCRLSLGASAMKLYTRKNK